MSATRTAVLLALGLVGCASSTRPIATLPAAAFQMPQRYVVITVPNPVSSILYRAASTPRGYDNAGPYMLGAVARRAGHNIAVSYRLREVSSWPIAVLSANCIVYELPADTEIESLLEALTRDVRVNSAQPLSEFSLKSRSTADHQ